MRDSDSAVGVGGASLFASGAAAAGSGALAVSDGLDTAYVGWNPESDMGNIEIWEQNMPMVYLGRSIGGITQPMIGWQNRPTYQQAVEVQGHRPRP